MAVSLGFVAWGFWLRRDPLKRVDFPASVPIMFGGLYAGATLILVFLRMVTGA